MVWVHFVLTLLPHNYTEFIRHLVFCLYSITTLFVARTFITLYRMFMKNPYLFFKLIKLDLDNDRHQIVSLLLQLKTQTHELEIIDTQIKNSI